MIKLRLLISIWVLLLVFQPQESQIRIFPHGDHAVMDCFKIRERNILMAEIFRRIKCLLHFYRFHPLQIIERKS